MSSPILSKWVDVITSGFNKILNTSDNTVQKALNTLDQHTHTDLDTRITSLENEITIPLINYFYEVKSSNSYLYRGSIVAYDRMFINSTIKDIYVYNTTAGSHILKIYKNSIEIYSFNMGSTEKYKKINNVNLSCCAGDIISIYCSGSKPTNEIVILRVEGGLG